MEIISMQIKKRLICRAAHHPYLAKTFPGHSFTFLAFSILGFHDVVDRSACFVVAHIAAVSISAKANSTTLTSQRGLVLACPSAVISKAQQRTMTTAARRHAHVLAMHIESMHTGAVLH